MYERKFVYHQRLPQGVLTLEKLTLVNCPATTRSRTSLPRYHSPDTTFLLTNLTMKNTLRGFLVALTQQLTNPQNGGKRFLAVQLWLNWGRN